MKALLPILIVLILLAGAGGVFIWMTQDQDADPAAENFAHTETQPQSQERQPRPATAEPQPDPDLDPTPAPQAQPEPEPEEPASIPAPEPPPFDLPTHRTPSPQTRTLSYPADYWNGVRMEIVLNLRPAQAGARELADRPLFRKPRLSFGMSEPTANRDPAALARLNAHLTALLPAFAELIDAAEVSPYFADLYTEKKERNQDRLPRLDRVLSRHNYYDCETILALKHPETHRRAILIQSEMDVLTDGSDGDRMPEIAGESPTFQPFTSYGFPKQGDNPNPFLSQVNEEQRKLRAELERGPATARRREIQDRLSTLKRYEDDMKARSFLVGKIDPFIALPLSMLRGRDTRHKPEIGDYAVVIHEDNLYPAIVGDAGPYFKMGEASWLIAKEINPNTTIYSRPVSDLTVTYLVFPGTADPPAPPDYIKIRRRCGELLQELGGFEGDLHKWIEETGTEIAQSPPAGDRRPQPSPAFQTAKVGEQPLQNLIRQATPPAKAAP